MRVNCSLLNHRGQHGLAISLVVYSTPVSQREALTGQLLAHCRLTGGRRINNARNLEFAGYAESCRNPTRCLHYGRKGQGQCPRQVAPGKAKAEPNGWCLVSTPNKMVGKARRICIIQRVLIQCAQLEKRYCAKRPHLFGLSMRVVKCQTRPDKNGVPTGLRVRVPSRNPKKYARMMKWQTCLTQNQMLRRAGSSPASGTIEI